MIKSKRLMGMGLIAFALASPVHAQFSGLGGMLGGGSKAGSGDPAKIEQDLKSIIETTSIAMGKFAEALGMKEVSAKFMSNADCVKAGSCGLSDSISVIETSGPSVLAEAEKMKANGQKIDAKASASATQALLPAAKTFPLWKQVADGAKNLDVSSALKFNSLIQAGPKVPAAAKGTMDVVTGAISYLTFSGADTSELKNVASANMKF